MEKHQDAYLKAVQTSFLAYCFHTNKQYGWKPSVFHRYLCNAVDRFINEDTGHDLDILLLSVPPQHGKSMTVTETLPSYYLLRNPLNRVIEISYNEDFAQTFGRRNKEKVRDFGELFQHSLSANTKSNTSWELENERGGMISRGVSSGVTGNPANLMIIDDPIKNQSEADSETVRKKLQSEWLSSYRTRIAPGGKVIVIQTRWHEDDLFGFLERTEPNVTVLNLPCEAEENDPLGREVGEALCPEMGRGNEWLKWFKQAYISGKIEDAVGGERAWYALYQGRPTSVEGNLLKRDWWQKYEYTSGMEFDTVILSVDAAFKDKDTSDYVALEVWGRRGDFFYLIDCVNRHLNFMGTIREIKRLCATYDIQQKYIEDKANGTAIIEILRKELNGIMAVLPEGGKVARVEAVSYLVESGSVFLPDNRPFTTDFIEQCASFPNGKHDDMVDAFSQGLVKLERIAVSEKKRYRRKKPAFKGMQEPRKFGRGERINVV